MVFKMVLQMYSFLKIIKQCFIVGNFLDSNSIIKMYGINSDVKFVVIFVQHASCFGPKGQS
jgi:hypothetical protein